MKFVSMMTPVPSCRAHYRDSLRCYPLALSQHFVWTAYMLNRVRRVYLLKRPVCKGQVLGIADYVSFEPVLEIPLGKIAVHISCRIPAATYIQSHLTNHLPPCTSYS